MQRYICKRSCADFPNTTFQNWNGNTTIRFGVFAASNMYAFWVMVESLNFWNDKYSVSMTWEENVALSRFFFSMTLHPILPDLTCFLCYFTLASSSITTVRSAVNYVTQNVAFNEAVSKKQPLSFHRLNLGKTMQMETRSLYLRTMAVIEAKIRSCFRSWDVSNKADFVEIDTNGFLNFPLPSFFFMCLVMSHVVLVLTPLQKLQNKVF